MFKMLEDVEADIAKVETETAGMTKSPVDA